MLIEKAKEIIGQKAELEFLPGEPYRSILTMLYDYYSPEEVENVELKRFLNEVRMHLIDILIMHLQRTAIPETLDIFVEFMVPKPDNLFSTHDLLYTIISYESQEQRHSQRFHIFANYLRDSFQAKKKEYNFLTALHALIDNAINEKKKILKIETEKEKNKIDCCESIIAYSLHILLSINWSAVFDPNYVNTNSSPQKNYANPGHMLLAINYVLSIGENETENLFSYLNHAFTKGKNNITEEAILLFLFNRCYAKDSNSKEKFEKGYLGEKTYMCLLSHVIQDASLFNLKEREIPAKILDMKKQDTDNPHFYIIYSKIIENIMAFEQPVQEKIVSDLANLASKPAFQYYFSKSCTIFDSTTSFLSREKYLKNPLLKSKFENHFLFFISNIWSGRLRKDYALSIFKDLQFLPKDEFLYLYSKILEQLIKDHLNTSDEAIYYTIQFVYLLEDFAIFYPDSITQPLFMETLGKLELFLNEIHMIYYWYPTFIQFHLPHDIPFDPENYIQREGGVVRVLLKLLFTIIAKTCKGGLDELQNKLVLKLINFFIFRKKKTLAKLAQILNLQNLPSLQEVTQREIFLEFVSKTSIAKNKAKITFQDKSVVQLKTVEETCKLVNGKKEPLESSNPRAIYLYSQLSQILLYSIYNTTSYKEILLSEQKEPKEDKINGYRIQYLAKLLGKVIKTRAKMAGSVQLVIEEASKDLINLPKLLIENCFSNFDGYTRDKIESMRTWVDPQPARWSRANILLPSLLGGTTEPQATYEKFSQTELQAFQDECGKDLSVLHEYYCHYTNKNITAEKYVAMILPVIMHKDYIIKVQSKLHALATEDFVLIERMILAHVSSRQSSKKKMLGPKKLNKEYFLLLIFIREREKGIRMHNLVKESTNEIIKKSKCEVINIK